MNKKGEAITGVIITGALIAFVVGRAICKDQLKSPKFNKRKTVDTATNPATPHWGEDVYSGVTWNGEPLR